ncbi:MAG: hypothetical protein H0T53_01450 [Herpetosiphonaceae bacterium]|nr:hypothetical protein [Herpetosiphonaceae bacterium]
MAESRYAASNQLIEEWPELVRNNLGMYIGGNTEIALHNLLKMLVKEVLLDKTYPSTHIEIILYADGSYLLNNNADFSQLSLTDIGLVSQWFPGFNPSPTEWSYAAVANASAEWFQRVIATGKTVYRDSFENVQSARAITVEENTQPTGQTIHFLPDPTLFIRQDGSAWSYLLDTMRDIAVFSAQHTFRLINQQLNLETSFCYPEGLSSYVAELLSNYTNPPEPLAMHTTAGLYQVEVALEWCYADPFFYSFANSERTIYGGTHVVGFWRGLVAGLKTHIHNTKQGYGKDFHVSQAALQPYVRGALSVHIPKPIWARAAKVELANPEIANIVAKTVRNQLPSLLQLQPLLQQDVLDSIITKLQRK